MTDKKEELKRPEKVMMKDNLRIEHADICIRCQSVKETAQHNYLRWCVCGECSKKLKEILKGYEENGLYLTREGKL